MDENNLHNVTEGTRTPWGVEAKSPHHKSTVRCHTFHIHDGHQQMLNIIYCRYALGSILVNSLIFTVRSCSE